MRNEIETQSSRTQRSDKKSKQTKSHPAVRLQQRKAVQELPRDERRQRASHQGRRSVLSSGVGKQRPIRYFSTFSGIGGFELGIARATGDKARGEQPAKERQHQQVDVHAEGSREASCVGFSEIDRYAAHIYQSHFPAHNNCGDITRIDADSLPDFDLFVGGFPCQAFSVAGKRLGFEDTRGTLFFEVARILKAKQPRHFLLENVKGLLSHDNGRTFKTIISALAELGYCVEWQVLNSKDIGVPQNRERVFVVGHLGGQPARTVFPFDGNDREDFAICKTPGETADTLVSTYARNQSDGQYVVGTYRTHNDGAGFRRVKSGLAPTIPARAREDGSGQGVIKTGMRVRRLTPLECERLQGFPDGWTEGISDTQRYKCLGNAVTVNVIEAVISRLL